MTDNQQENLKNPRIHCITTHHTAHARAIVFGERRRLFLLGPTAIGRVLVRVRVYTTQSGGAVKSVGQT